MRSIGSTELAWSRLSALDEDAFGDWRHEAPETGLRLCGGTNMKMRQRNYPTSPIRGLEARVAERTDVSVFRLNIGQPDLPPPRCIVSAMTGSSGGDRAGRFGYGPAMGSVACREAIASYCREIPVDVAPRDIAVTHGASEALLLTLAAIAGPGDEVLVVEPFYANYLTFAAMLGVRLVPVARRSDGGFGLPPESVLDEARSPRSRAVLYSNPCNPTGAVYPASDIERLGWWCRRHDLALVADEVYRHIWFDEAAPSALAAARGCRTVVVVESLSKAWCAPGLRAGFLVCSNRSVMNQIERLCQARLGAQPAAQAALEVAVGLPEDYYHRRRRLWRERVMAMSDALDAVDGVRHCRPAGAFYAMAELPVVDAGRFAEYLAVEFEYEGETVLLAPGEGFYVTPHAGKSSVRLAAVLPPDQLRRAVRVMAAGLEAWQLRMLGVAG